MRPNNRRLHYNFKLQVALCEGTTRGSVLLTNSLLGNERMQLRGTSPIRDSQSETTGYVFKILFTYNFSHKLNA